MKLAIVLLALVGIVAAASVADKAFFEKQKFLYEIVYRMEDPLMFEEYIKFGDKFYFDKSYYSHYDYYMEKFYEAFKYNALLPKGEFFGALVKTHYQQAYGLFNYFYYAKDFETFKHNVAWARMHVNEGMFVYALTLAVIHRDDFKGLGLPSINEIFPQHFFNSKFIYDAEKFDYEVFSKYTAYEKEYNDILYKDYTGAKNKPYYYYYGKDWKTYQWYKLMGLQQTWYAFEGEMLRDNVESHKKNYPYNEITKDFEAFYYPVDYTRDVHFYNEHSTLSYFTEDVDWNTYWYYFNLDYAFFLDGKTFGLEKDRRGEYWLYNVQQILARYYMERLSNGFGSIPEFSFFHQYDYGYDPELISYNGVGFTYRKNYFQYESYGNFDMLNKVYSFYQRVYDIIDTGYYKTYDGKTIDFRKPESVEYIGNLMQGNIDTFDKFFFNYWYLLSHMYFAQVDYYDYEVQPSVFLNFETMLRDPLFYSFYKKITDVFYHFKYYLKPYTYEELYFPGVTFKDVEVPNVNTFFDFNDFDVTNLYNDKPTFVDGKFVWDKTLLARQARLNFDAFDFEYTIESDKAQKVVIRTFYGPKYDEFGHAFNFHENRKNFVQIDAFVYSLNAGKNEFKRSTNDFDWTRGDKTTYTELYKYLMLASEGKAEYDFAYNDAHCAFPEHLLFPRGTEAGYPIQFYFFASPYTAKSEQYSNYDSDYYCGIGSGTRHVDDYPFGYPFDREIDEFNFYVPNGYFADTKIYYTDRFSKYYDGAYEYKKFGTFDYSIVEN